MRLSGEILVGTCVGLAIAAAAGVGAGEQAAPLAAAAAVIGAAGAAILVKAHSNAPDGALMAMRDKAAAAEARADELADLQDEIEERAACAAMVIRAMAEDLQPDSIEPSEVERALRYLADPDARLKKPFGPWPRDAAEIAVGQGGRT